MLVNKRGAALLQVLIVTAILTGMAALILRLSLARTITSRQTRHIINAQTVVESCMAEVNSIWAAKTPEAYARDLAVCQMCKPGAEDCTNGEDGNYQKHICSVSLDADLDYTVEAKIEKIGSSSSSTPPCKITYTITNSTNNARQTL